MSECRPKVILQSALNEFAQIKIAIVDLDRAKHIASEHTVGILSQYTFVHSRRSWNASQAYCQRMGGNLAVITTLEEERNLMRIIKEKYSWDQAFWIGAKKGEYEVGVSVFNYCQL